MKKFPASLLVELQTLFSSSGITVYRNPTMPQEPPDPILRSLKFREGSGTGIIHMILEFYSGRQVKVILVAGDFDASSELAGQSHGVSPLADEIYMLMIEWVFGREVEPGFPNLVYLRPYESPIITKIEIALTLKMSSSEVPQVPALVFLDGQQVGILTKQNPLGTFVVLRRDYRVHVDINGHISDVVRSKSLWNRTFICRVEGSIVAPTITLIGRGRIQRRAPQYPRLLTISSKEERAEIFQRQPFREAATAALHDAAGILEEARIDVRLEKRGWSLQLAEHLAIECRRLAAILEDTDWQLTRNLGDLGLERWLSAYVPLSSTGEDVLQNSVLRAAGALRRLTAESED